MLKSIRLQNFFGFQDCTINLEKGANVLVGVNGSGKSNFFKAVRLLIALTREKELTNLLYKDFGGLDNIIFSDKNKNLMKSFFIGVTMDFLPARKTEFAINIMSDFGSGYMVEREYYNELGITNNLTYETIERQATSFDVNLLKSGIINKETYQIDSHSSLLNINLENIKSGTLSLFRRNLPQFKFYNGFNSVRDSALRNPNPPSLDKYLLHDGTNLASLLNDIKLTDKETFNHIINALKNVNEKFIGVEFKQLSGFIELWLEEEGLNRAISPINISDGTLKFLCLMTILYNPNRGSVICIDEPEVGLHPDMINSLHEAIEFAAETSQIIISTHSAHLLNYFEIEQVRVFEKDENNATVVNQFSKELYAGWKQKFQLGKAWREGVIGGNR